MKSLRTKILMTMVLAMLASVLISSLVSTYILRSQFRHHHEECQLILQQVVQNALELAMMRNHPEEIQETAEVLRRQSRIQSLRILNSEGVVRYSTTPNERGLKFSRHLEKLKLGKTQERFWYETRDARQFLALIDRIPNRSACSQCHNPQDAYLGYLVLESDITSIHRHVLGNSIINIVMAAGTMLVLAAAIAAVHLRFVQRNLKKMLRGIQEVQEGNFQTHITIQARDEMGELAGSFNHMIDRLNEARRELDQLHQSQLERAEKLASVGELAAGLAHEIKNPVAGISNALQIILEDMDKNDKNLPIFEEMLRQIQRVDQAVNSLLSYARPRPPKFVSSSLNEVISAAFKLVRQQAKIGRVEIIYRGDYALPHVVVDPQQIEQVLVNLMMNAIQAMPQGGSLEVIQEQQDSSHAPQILIKDTGMGIKPEVLKNIFKPFFTTRHRGTGLGLTICQGIIERHGGKITVESELGKGAVFTVTLPLEGNLQPAE